MVQYKDFFAQVEEEEEEETLKEGKEKE